MTIKKLTKAEYENLNILKNYYYIIIDIFRDYTQTQSNELKYFQAIPMSSSVISDLATIRKSFNEIPKLLDVGCGKGNILSLASVLGFNAHGIEYRKEYKEDLIKIRAKFKIGEAFDIKDYDYYDVIYAYMPISDHEKMFKLLNVIDNQISEGKLILFYGNCKIPTLWKRYKEIQNLYIKIKIKKI